MKIIDIQKYRSFTEERRAAELYRAQMTKLPKSELLLELIRYHEQFINNPSDVKATLQGQALMDILEQRAELNELKDLSREFRAKLNQRLQAQLSLS